MTEIYCFKCLQANPERFFRGRYVLVFAIVNFFRPSSQFLWSDGHDDRNEFVCD